MDTFLLLKLLHILGATVLFGTGIGIAFFMVMAHRTGNAKTIADVARIVVIADFVFTASAVIVQPMTGLLLVWKTGASLTERWIVQSLALYVVTGLIWLPVVVMQMRMRDLAQEAADNHTPLPTRYYRLFWGWFAFGWPAFGAVIAIFWLMITKRGLW